MIRWGAGDRAPWRPWNLVLPRFAWRGPPPGCCTLKAFLDLSGWRHWDCYLKDTPEHPYPCWLMGPGKHTVDWGPGALDPRQCSLVPTCCRRQKRLEKIMGWLWSPSFRAFLLLCFWFKAGPRKYLILAKLREVCQWMRISNITWLWSQSDLPCIPF